MKGLKERLRFGVGIKLQTLELVAVNRSRWYICSDLSVYDSSESLMLSSNWFVQYAKMEILWQMCIESVSG